MITLGEIRNFITVYKTIHLFEANAKKMAVYMNSHMPKNPSLKESEKFMNETLAKFDPYTGFADDE